MYPIARDIIDDYDIKMFNENILPTKEAGFVGIKLDNKLNFNSICKGFHSIHKSKFMLAVIAKLATCILLPTGWLSRTARCHFTLQVINNSNS